MSTISFTIPNDPLVCRAMANYLLSQAGDECTSNSEPPGVTVVVPHQELIRSFGTGPEAHTFGTEGPDIESPELAAEIHVGGVTAEVTGAPVAPPPSDVQLDKNGLPWDGRIHASSKALLQDQTWRKKRGVADYLVAQVETELRALMAAPAPAPAPEPSFQTVSEGEATPPTRDAATAFGDAPAPAPAPTPASAPAPPKPALTLADLITKITQAAIPMDRVTEVLNAEGVAALPLLGARPDLIPAVAAKLGLQ